MTTFVIRFGKRIKVWLNFFLDRILDACNFLIFWSGLLPGFLQNGIKEISYLIGDLALFINFFPRMNVYQIKGNSWTIVFVGSQGGLLELQGMLFYGKEFTTQELERVAVWNLPNQSKRWLAAGTDLVICELCRHFPWKPSASYSFSGPDWVMQAIDIPDSPEELLAGRRLHGQRNRIRNCEKQGFSYRFSHALNDYHFFYNEMYLPFIKRRHGEQALVVPMKDQYKRWFKPGGLVLVTQDDQPVAAELLVRIRKTCYSIEMGVFQGDPKWIEAGVNAFLQWSTILWCHAQGVKLYILGGTQAWSANGAFTFKAKWGARVVKQKRITPLWYYCSERLPVSLRESLNQLGIISENKGKYYCTFLSDGNQNQDGKIDEALSHGFSGLAFVQNGLTHYLSAQPKNGV